MLIKTANGWSRLACKAQPVCDVQEPDMRPDWDRLGYPNTDAWVDAWGLWLAKPAILRPATVPRYNPFIAAMSSADSYAIEHVA